MGKLVIRNMVVAFGLMAVLLSSLIAQRAAGNERPVSSEAVGAWTTATPEEVDTAIQIILAAEPGHHLMRSPADRLALAERIVEVSNQREVPPLLTTSIVFRESSFDEKAIGKRGEIGLMQVAKRNVRIYLCDMTSATGQIACGAGMLRQKYDVCGTWGGAMTSYGTTSGACKTDDVQVQNKVKMRLRDWQRYSRSVQALLYEQGAEE